MVAGLQAWQADGNIICDLSTINGLVHGAYILPQYHPGARPSDGQVTVGWPNLPGTRWWYYTQPIFSNRSSKEIPWIPIQPRFQLSGDTFIWDWPMYELWTRNYDGGDGDSVHRNAILGGGTLLWGIR